MPNTPCSVMCGAIAYSPGPTVNEDDCCIVETLFKAVGLCVKLPEHLIGKRIHGLLHIQLYVTFCK